MNKIPWIVRGLVLCAFAVLVLIAPPVLTKVVPDLKNTNPYILAGALFAFVALIAAVVGLIAGGLATDSQMKEMVSDAKKVVKDFSHEATELRNLIATFSTGLDASHQKTEAAVRTLEGTAGELSLSLKMHLQIVREQFGQSLITYEGMAKIEASVPSGDDILILTSALELEEGELAGIIRSNLSRGVKYTYLIPAEDLTVQERIQRLARQWQQDCKLTRTEAETRIKCVLVPEHFAYMTVAVYSAYAKKPVVLVKFPASPVFSENRYPLIYRVADEPRQAAKVFVDALQGLIADGSACAKTASSDSSFWLILTRQMSMKRLTYLPWSPSVLADCLRAYDRDQLGSLDLDLTAKCTLAACIYCDSKPSVGSRQPGELNFRETNALLEGASVIGLKWIFSCGLGEPLEDCRFKELVDKAASLGIRVSLFTNALAIDMKRADWLRKMGVCLIVKLDSLNESTFDRILGRNGAARHIYRAIEYLFAAGYGKGPTDGLTDIAFSIVPTKLSVDDVPDVIRFAKDHNAFASVGELEQAGMVLARKHYAELAVDGASLMELKADVERLLWPGYKRPICPSILAGIHVDNIGNCVVDAETGLNCKWFLLREPKTKVIGNVRKTGVADLLKQVREYRRRCFAKNTKHIRKAEAIDFVFGGCGGNPSTILRLARQHL